MINSLGEVVMPDYTWTNWQVYIPESLITDSTYAGLVYGFIFEETKSICVVDDLSYFFPEKVVGYIGTNAPVWSATVAKNYKRTVFFTGRYTDDKIEGYIISNNSAFGAYPLATHERALNTLESFLEKIQARELEEIGRATIIPYSINNIVIDNNKSWNVYVPKSILSNPIFCGDVYGKCSNNSVFIYDTLKFPEMKAEKDRIGYICGNSDNIAAAISCLRNDGNDIIIGEYVDSILRFYLASEGVNPDGTCWNEEEYTYMVIHKREESNSLTDEAVAGLIFQLSETCEIHPNNDAIAALRNELAGGGETMVNNDGTALNPAEPSPYATECTDIGFEPVDACIEPWYIPFWNRKKLKR